MDRRPGQVANAQDNWEPAMARVTSQGAKAEANEVFSR